ncbi:MAG: transposase [Candidatus Omnitrophica bacterium]|nr:transposase [Candidatus Omnitrophota bacterium]
MPKPITRRNTNRIPKHNYSTPGQYFVTILTCNRKNVFGVIENNLMLFNEFGFVADEIWRQIPARFPESELDKYIIMPNHIHGIINIVGAIHESPDDKSNNKYRSFTNKIPKNNNKINHNDNSIRAIQTRAIHESPLQHKRRNMTLSKTIGYFKMQTAKQINILKNTPRQPVWQRNYHDHVIRNDKSINKIREYIVNNPINWQFDIENPNRIGNIEIEGSSYG